MKREVISFEHKGDFSNTFNFLNKIRKNNFEKMLIKCGELGVAALSSATPVDTGLTAKSWYYEIKRENGRISLNFCNSNIQNGWCNVAIILQYGHATRNGGWVEGMDYINPAIRPIFDKLAKDAWEEVTK